MNVVRWIRFGSAAIVLPLILTQCALPPREAWRTIQSRGLFTYWSQQQTGVGAPYRPEMLGSGLRRNSQPLYVGRYAQLENAPRYNTQRSSSASSTRSTSDRSRSAKPKVSSSVASTTTKPKPKPKPKAKSEPTVAASKPSASKTKPKTAAAPSKKPETGDSPSTNATTKPAVANADLPFGRSVAGRPGLVTSPYAGSSQLVDVTGMTVGQPVKCPYTGKLFKVPASSVAKSSGEAGE